MRTLHLVALLAVGGVSVASALVQSELFLPAGNPAPAFAAPGSDGKDYTLAGLTKEKPVFVVFWKQRCPHNPKAAALINSIQQAYAGKANMVGVVNANQEGAKAWVDQFSLKYPLIADPAKAAISAYKLRYSIATVQIGTDGKITKVFEGYGAEQLKALNEAMAAAAGVKPAEVDLTGAPGRLQWG